MYIYILCIYYVHVNICKYIYIYLYLCICIYTYIHTIHYITLHYATLRYITLHPHSDSCTKTTLRDGTMRIRLRQGIFVSFGYSDSLCGLVLIGFDSIRLLEFYFTDTMARVQVEFKY